jgi:hypothetical protein
VGCSASPHKAKSAVLGITLTPEGRAFIASGSWDLLGEGSVAVTMVPGGPVCTILPQAKFLVDLAA